MNNYSYVHLYYTTLYTKVNTNVKKNTHHGKSDAYTKTYLILFSDNSVFTDVPTVIFAGLSPSLTFKKLAVFVLVKLKVAIALPVLIVIYIIPTGIAQICHQFNIPSSSLFGLPTATVSLLSFIIGIIKPGIPAIDVVLFIIWRTNGKIWSNEST